MGSLTFWEIAAAVTWTLYCLGSLRAARQGQRSGTVLSYATLWMVGFLGTFALLQVVRLPPLSATVQPMTKSVAGEDSSKLPKIASARD